jgi:hypothetical protein
MAAGMGGTMAESQEEFFKSQIDYHVVTKFYGCERSFTVEEMYQHFKARLLSEIAEAKRENEVGR